MTQPKRSHAYVTPVGRVRYTDDAFGPPNGEVLSEVVAEGLQSEIVARFHAIIEELTDQLMSAGDFDRASCRADAITLLTAASDRLQRDEPVESPLSYLLMEERQKASASMGGASSSQALTFIKG